MAWLHSLCVVGAALGCTLNAFAQDAPSAPAATPSVVKVVMQTTLGEIRLELDAERAPATVGNFLRYVDLKRFDEIDFYRAVHIGDDGKYGLVQAGLQGNSRRLFPPIVHEPTNATGLSHKDGAISMARGEPGSATADFFIVVGDLVSLDAKANGTDAGYAAFGRVTDGMDVVRKILQAPIDAGKGDASMKGQMLAEPVAILTTRRVD